MTSHWNNSIGSWTWRKGQFQRDGRAFSSEESLGLKADRVAILRHIWMLHKSISNNICNRNISQIIDEFQLILINPFIVLLRLEAPSPLITKKGRRRLFPAQVDVFLMDFIQILHNFKPSQSLIEGTTIWIRVLRVGIAIAWDMILISCHNIVLLTIENKNRNNTCNIPYFYEMF
jgi:hypothetical protein